MPTLSLFLLLLLAYFSISIVHIRSKVQVSFNWVAPKPSYWHRISFIVVFLQLKLLHSKYTIKCCWLIDFFKNSYSAAQMCLKFKNEEWDWDNKRERWSRSIRSNCNTRKTSETSIPFASTTVLLQNKRNVFISFIYSFWHFICSIIHKIHSIQFTAHCTAKQHLHMTIELCANIA